MELMHVRLLQCEEGLGISDPRIPEIHPSFGTAHQELESTDQTSHSRGDIPSKNTVLLISQRFVMTWLKLLISHKNDWVVCHALYTANAQGFDHSSLENCTIGLGI